MQRNYYSNPAFTQQSEFYGQKSPIRQSPVGAQDVPMEEQDFYEEMLVDDQGHVKEKKIVVVSSDVRNGNGNHVIIDQNGSRYAMVPLEESRPKHRYEYIPMLEHDVNQNPQQISYTTPTNSPTRKTTPRKLEKSPKRYPEEEYQLSNGKVHRYAVISVDEDLEDLPRYPVRTQLTPKSKPIRPIPNPIATQKLYELLSTPKKASPRTQHTPSKRPLQPKAQQRLNYGGNRPMDKRTTAIVAPMCASPIQNVYTETTISQKSESWMNLSGKKQPVHVTLTVASLMMILSGGLASTLCFYMVSMLGRLYYLDFGIVAGFACLVLGILGYRARHYYYWLPNRNYMSGYIILTLFSLLTCVGLLLLLYLQPKPGTPLADMTSGAVCGISALSLIFASSGVAASYCCKLPPPDNRVEHCARGFTV